jgi:hypothetical protein
MALALYILVIESIFIWLCYKVDLGLIQGSPLHEPDVGQLVNGHFVDNSFLIILKD